eukprot:TRINITY_DN12134_c0_g2_i1.p1 TRINITY_DN12134_c0_g2~~TRINITY_DN12134_c0_g2_i1.p1  ORF type:complete len:301 (-),score=70.35 TRINITY_DN12134_c0_g2_i1:708-1610(-)
MATIPAARSSIKDRRRSMLLAALPALAMLCYRDGQALAALPARRAVMGALLPGLLGAASKAQAAGEKVVVLGGSGFVGQRVCERLATSGAEVVSVSRSGGPPAGLGPWAEKVRWVKGDVLSMDMFAEVSGASAVISAIGAIGSDNDAALNGATAERAVEAASKAGVQRFVLVSATPLVAESGVGSFFPGYVDGKKRAEAAVSSFPGKALISQPTFVFGGSEFSANPPRVAEGYGAFVETVLGSPPVRAIASVSPTALKLALLPPSAVTDVAAAAVAGAQGRVTGVLSSHDEIKTAAGSSE